MAFRLRHLRTYATLLALTSLAACSSKNDPTPAADAAGMSWTVDGSNVTAIMTDKTVSADDIKLDGATGTISGSTVVELTMPKKVGTYDLASGSTNAIAIYAIGNTSSGTGYFATSGTITVSNLSATNVTGTFTFKGEELGGTKPAKTITNGKFNIAL